MANLVTQQDIASKIGRDLTAEEDTAYSILYAAMVAWVEGMIGSSISPAELTTRYYDGGVHNLSIDPCTEIESIKYVDHDYNVDSSFADNEFTAEPVNRTLKFWLRCRHGRFMRGENNVAVEAKFSIAGDAGVLAQVKDAILSAMVSEIGNTDNLVRESIEGYSVEFAQSETKDALSKIKLLFPGI